MAEEGNGINKELAILISEANEDAQSKETELVPTKIYQFDKMIGGGIPRKKITYIVGFEGSGKTTLLAQITSRFQKLGFICIFVDSEHALEKKRMSTLGIDTEKLIYKEFKNIEDLANYIEKVCKNKENNKIKSPVLIVWDSLASSKSQVTIEAELGQAQVGVEARLFSKMFPELVGKMEKYDITLIMTNQYRANIQINPFAKQVDSLKLGREWALPGGFSPKFYAYLMITMEAKSVYSLDATVEGTDRKREIEAVGRIIEAKTLKNKSFPPLIKSEFALVYSMGFSNLDTMLHTFIKEKIIVNSKKGYRKIGEYDFDFKLKDFRDVFERDSKFREVCMNYYNEYIDDLIEPSDLGIEDVDLSLIDEELLL